MFEKKTPTLPAAMRGPLCGLFALLLSFGSFAQAEDAQLEPPPLPARVESGEVMEPQVTIVPGPKQTVHEYRIHGRLYAVKVIPENGPSYYLVDTNGDGTLDHHEEGPTENLHIPMWVLFSW